MHNITEALGIMGKGMLGIFVVIGLIALIVMALTKVGNK
ncbi:sodium pump decarboxylase gamma subunit [bacterium D16-76]|nr:sodium pump decarboxylase gamma subunit [bacterium D16-76]